MPSNLHVARDFANHIRFSGDIFAVNVTSYSEQSHSLKSLFYSNELQISKEVTPELYSSLCSALEQLSIPLSSVEAFVYASPEIEAQCFSGHTSDCVIRFSSALVDILSIKEFEFVVGHELGHFLLSHSAKRAINANESIEYYMQQRAQEISADRLGLIACGSLDVAVKAFIKTVSGLNDNHLRLDVGSFMSQLKKSDGSPSHNYQSTHPSILVRCRALLWFSLNESYINNDKEYAVTEMKKLDELIKNDLGKYTDKSARNMIEDAKHNLSMWMAASDIIHDGKFSKHEQERFRSLYGEETLEKMISFLNNLSANELENTINSRVEEARRELESLIPSSFERELNTLIKFKR